MHRPRTGRRAGPGSYRSLGPREDRRGYAATARLSRQAAAAFGCYDRNTGINPLTVEAKKTVAFEVWEQLGRETSDVVIVPVGDGPTLSGIAKGFRELAECGVARRVPRIVGVQAEGCQPIKLAWQTNSRIKAVQPATVADGIAVGHGPQRRQAARRWIRRRGSHGRDPARGGRRTGRPR